MEPSAASKTARRVSVSEAARELGVSPETVRRWIKTGRLRAERAVRPQGTVWWVTLPVTTPRGVAAVTSLGAASDQEARHASTGGVSHPSAPVARSASETEDLVAVARRQQETIASLVADLAEARGASDARAEQIIRLTETLAELRDERGRIAAELETAAAEAMTAKMRESRLADELTELRATLARYTEILIRKAGAPMPEGPAVVVPVRWRRWAGLAAVGLAIVLVWVLILSWLPSLVRGLLHV